MLLEMPEIPTCLHLWSSVVDSWMKKWEILSINKRKCYHSFPAFYKSKNKEYFKLEREKSSQYLFLVGKKRKDTDI